MIPETSGALPRPSAIWDPRFLEYDFGPGHPFVMAYRELAVDLLEATSPGGFDWVRAVEPAALATLRDFHREEYLQLVEHASTASRPIWLDGGDTPGFAGCHEVAARVVGGALAAVSRSVRDGGPSFHPAGGLHHAHPDRASGFCIYNDVALAVVRALRETKRVAYVDIDAHHGDGVMYGFYDSGDLLNIDFHQDGRTLFPGTGDVDEIGRDDGAGLKVNIPLPPHAGDTALIHLFDRVAKPMLEEFRPAMIILQHGVDGHSGDPLAQLEYSVRGYSHVLREVIALARRHAHGRLVVTGGGGYRPENVALALANAGRELMRGAGESVPSDPPSAEWKARFGQRTGGLAPSHWIDPGAPAAETWSEDVESALVERLERSLGRRFPRSA